MTYPKQKHTITMVCVQSMSKINLTGWYLYQSVPDLGLHQKCTIWSEKSLGVNTFRSTHSFTSEGQFFGEEKRSSRDTWHISTLLWSFGFHELLWPQILTAKLISSLREGLNWKKAFSFGHCPNDGGGVYPCPNFLALFQEVHFWSIKRVYFFKNANECIELLTVF